MNNKSKPWLPGHAKPPGVRNMTGKKRKKKKISNSRLKEVAATMELRTVVKPAGAPVLNGDQSNTVVGQRFAGNGHNGLSYEYYYYY